MMQRWILGARLRTLPAAVVPVMVGTAAAAGNGIIW
ncbi:MAG: 1,4-dihydroxy-2-naphthoate polyprenyltransferase, partial [Actinobacteria bacterium]|nr:1,4-dihydroxy-2-naphthoate polyprenyltransferase [Actinomycetota bacterium]MBT4009470.1 1,4-dihydroxy-2-naphthoate polyprenyltransferase [Actinomycetota bacterium]